MAVSKRLRYEILRRDTHACRYCGATAPDVKLTVDHVVPTALGGSDEPANLVTACAACNSGKSSSSPDAPIVDDVAADALRWARAMERAAELQTADRAAITQYVDDFLSAWDFLEQYFKVHGQVPLPTDWETSIRNFRAVGLSTTDLTYAADAALTATHVPLDRVWRYFCGVAWRVAEQRREIAASLIQADEVAPDGS